jgi:pimeloyl-ACP methyl ester carboxylesterase
LQEGQARAVALLNGASPWTTQKGLVVRGFRSRIDRTLQPYGLVVPESYSGTGKDRYRLDLWLHGRGERSSEPVFIAGRMANRGRYAPQDTIVLHPYGRYSNAFKFAGEVDVLEALAHAKQNYRVDDDRIAVRGFSMGGAGCWQLAVHFPDLFFAANPGAGFSETPEFLKFFQQETLHPTWYEKKLWTMYDCPGYASNLFNLPTVAYSGELDIQKQAADIMEQALAEKSLRLTHVIGPDTKHTIDPKSMRIIEAKLDQLAERGRPKLPHEVRFSTYTLKYNRMHWLRVTELGEHWEQATVRGRILPNESTVDLDVHNVKGLRLEIPAGRSPFVPDRPVKVSLTHGPRQRTAGVPNETQTVIAMRPGTDRSWECELRYDGEQWQLGRTSETGLRKRHDLQGPIDDAFMDSFIVVRPTGKARHAAVGNWANAELDHFVREWRRQFRGDAVVKRDDEVTKADIAANHLILFGDPSSNSVMASIVDELPVRWTGERIAIGDKTFEASRYAPVLIYPNPANPKRYVVLNSGFTYREFAYLNNARQVPKLPDWAVVDLNTPPNSLWPGRIVDADFFDEQWQVK